MTDLEVAVKTLGSYAQCSRETGIRFKTLRNFLACKGDLKLMQADALSQYMGCSLDDLTSLRFSAWR